MPARGPMAALTAMRIDSTITLAQTARAPARPGHGACRILCICAALLAASGSAVAAPPFSGVWTIDLRTPAEKRQKVECGAAGFQLVQRGARISGDHWMSTAGCGRLNEGGEETVSGEASGRTATLTVVSGRNGQVVRGVARIEGKTLHWEVVEELKPGEPENDSGLILHEGVLGKEK